MIALLAILASAPTYDFRADLEDAYVQRGISKAGAQALVRGQEEECLLLERQRLRLRDVYLDFEKVRDARPFVFANYEGALRAFEAFGYRMTVERTDAELARLRTLTPADREIAVSFGRIPRCPSLAPPSAPAPPHRP